MPLCGAAASFTSNRALTARPLSLSKPNPASAQTFGFIMWVFISLSCWITFRDWKSSQARRRAPEPPENTSSAHARRLLWALRTPPPAARSGRGYPSLWPGSGFGWGWGRWVRLLRPVAAAATRSDRPAYTLASQPRCSTWDQLTAHALPPALPPARRRVFAGVQKPSAARVPARPHRHGACGDANALLGLCDDAKAAIV